MYHHPVVSGTFINLLRRLVTRNPSFARSSIDCLAFTVFIIGGHLALWFELCHVLPYYYNTHDVSFTVVCHYVVAFTVYINAFSNLYYTINTPSSGSYLEICSKRQDSWHYCSTCQCYAPPRCHHCAVCAVCVLKRDHHCWFAGCCVGHDNYRFYFAMVFTVWFGAVYANIFHYSFIEAQHGGLSVGMVFCTLFPHVAGILGYLTLYQFFLTLMSFVALLCLFLFSWLLGLQVVQLYSGQTEYERSKGQYDYDRGARQNLRDALGHRWFLVLLSPWIPSDLSSDGMSFAVSEKEE